jgi:hypothetical protein
MPENLASGAGAPIGGAYRQDAQFWHTKRRDLHDL